VLQRVRVQGAVQPYVAFSEVGLTKTDIVHKCRGFPHRSSASRRAPSFGFGADTRALTLYPNKPVCCLVEVFVARQPIFDATREVIGYELLFRDGLANAFSGIDGTEATRQVMLNTFVLFGLHRLTSGRPAFVNFTREALLGGMATLFPTQSLVIEVLETVEEEPEVVEQCHRLRDLGYTIALDDFTNIEGHEALVECADIIKVDFRLVAPEQRRDLAAYFRNRKVRLLGEKVETYEDFREAQDVGYALFQGYFFAKPEVLNRADVPGRRTHHVQLLRELQKPKVKVDDIETIIKQDLALSYRLLRYINSSLFGLRSEIQSVRHALLLMGERDVRRWATLAALSSLANDKPPELIELGLARARFCENLRPMLGQEPEAAEELFLLGLFSVLDACMDISMQDALKELAVPARVRGALTGVEGELRDVLDLVRAFERADWETIDAKAKGLEHDALIGAHLASLDWARAACNTQYESRRPSAPPH